MTGASCYKYVNNRICQVLYCPNKGSNCNLPFFLLSRNDTVKYEKWTRHIKLKPSGYVLKKIYICSDHFELKFFTSTLRRKLSRFAYPTLQRKVPEEIPDLKQMEESHFVWNTMPKSENSKNCASNSEDTCIIASLYIPSEDSKSNEVNNLSEIDINQRTFQDFPQYQRYPVLYDKRFLENRGKFLEEVIDDYMKKRYVSENEEENKKLFKEKIDSLRDPNILREEWIAMKLAERYGTEKQSSNTKVATFSKQSSIINDSNKKMFSEKTNEACSTQNQVLLASLVKSANSTLDCNPQSSPSSISTMHSRTPTKAVNQKTLPMSVISSIPIGSTINVKGKAVLPEKAIIIRSVQNQVLMKSSVQSENRTLDCNPQSSASSISTMHSRTHTKPINQKTPPQSMIAVPIRSTINEKGKEVLSEKAIITCSAQNQVLFESSVQSKNRTLDCNPQSSASSISTMQSKTSTEPVNQKTPPLSMISIPICSTINEKDKEVLSEKTIIIRSAQNQVLMKSPVQSKIRTLDCNPQSSASSISTLQLKTHTKPINQKTLPQSMISIPIRSTIDEKDKEVLLEKATIIHSAQNQMLLKSPVQSENTTIEYDPQSDTSSISSMKSRTPTEPVNQKSSMPLSINHKGMTVLPEKATKTCSTQNEVLLTSTVQPKNTMTTDCDSLSYAPSTSTVQLRTPTKPDNQKSPSPSISSVQPKKVMMVPISAVLSKNLKLATNQKSFIYSTSTFKSKNVLVVDDLQNINPSTAVKQSKNEVETCQPRKVMKLMSTNNEFSSSDLDHIYTKTINCNSSTENNVTVQPKLLQNKSKDDCMSEKDCDSIASDIANELKEIRDVKSRSEVLSKIQKLLEEAKSKACL